VSDDDQAAPPPREDDRYLVCHCLAVDRRTVRAAIRAGAKTVEDLQRSTGACTGCHTCYPDCLAMLKEQAPADDASSAPK
jgi:NAD(P)H-nitrite reductase large subunit